MSLRVGRLRVAARVVAVLASASALGGPVGAQDRPALQVEREDGSFQALPVAAVRGYAALPVSVFRTLGWVVREEDGRVGLSIPGRAEIELRVGSPFFRWGAQPMQLVDAPYREGSEAYLPVQLLTDFFPERLPEYYDYDARSGRIRAGDPSRAPASGVGSSGGSQSQADGGDGVVPTPPTPYDGVRVVWIDAGHGGADPGAIGNGVREKDVALGIARRLARILEAEERIEVRLTREDDGFVEVWDRGLLATDAKGERPGVFVSIHANSFPARRTTRGFETYFLSEARTEDERRVSAVENAPLSIRGRGIDAGRQSDLDFILRELRNFDHAHWSALLAGMVQEELGRFHPGPNRGVKQGPLAVLTNAIMPAVLVEVGFVTNADEARLLSQADFQDRSARGIANAVLRFLERYPPGNGLGGSR